MMAMMAVSENDGCLELLSFKSPLIVFKLIDRKEK